MIYAFQVSEPNERELVPPVCICNRPLQDILCRSCGHIFVGRVRKKCRYHPSEIHLMDMTCCPKCKTTSLLEIQGTAKRIISDQNSPQVSSSYSNTKPSFCTSSMPATSLVPGKVEQGSIVKPGNNMPKSESEDLVAFSKKITQASVKMGELAVGDTKSTVNPNLDALTATNTKSVTKKVSLVPPLTSARPLCQAKSVEFVQRKVDLHLMNEHDIHDLKISVCTGKAKSASNVNTVTPSFIQQTSEIPEKALSDRSVLKPKLVDSEVQTEFTVQVLDEPEWKPCTGFQSPLNKLSAKQNYAGTSVQHSQSDLNLNFAGNVSMEKSKSESRLVDNKPDTCIFRQQSASSQQKLVPQNISPSSLRIPVATSPAPRYHPHGNIPVLGDKGAGDMYCYKPKKAVGEPGDQNLLQKVLQQSRARSYMGTDFSDLTSQVKRF